MKKRKAWMALALALVMTGASIGCSPQQDAKQPSTNPQETQKENTEKPAENKEEKKDDQETNAEKLTAPDFIVFDKDGKQVKLSDFKGQASVINFWASW